MEQLIELLREMPVQQVALLLLVENILIFIGAVAFGHLLVHWFRHRQLSPEPEPIEPAEIFFTISTILLNTLITLAGWWLWRAGWIHFRQDTGPLVLLDVLILTLVMDAAMYLLHRIAHIARLFPLVHGTHHRYDKPRPLSLFVLNPFEALGFGILWLVVITLYPASWLGMGIYLVLNVIFGMVGHLGVEPLPDSWQRLPVLRYITTSTFHAQHHCDPDHNFGFYTLFWDQLFGTLSPRYASAFGRLQPEFAHEYPILEGDA